MEKQVDQLIQRVERLEKQNRIFKVFFLSIIIMYYGIIAINSKTVNPDGN